MERTTMNVQELASQMGISLPKAYKLVKTPGEYYGAAEPPVRCGESHLSGLTEPPHLFCY